MSTNFSFQTIDDLSQKLRKKEIRSVELTQFFLDRINALDPKINSFITVTPDVALQMARVADDKLQSGKNLTPLTGIPLGLKDILLTEGTKTTCGSNILNNFIAPYTATCVEKLKASGSVFLGKLNMDEFAMGSSTETSFFGPCRNPWDLERTPGGSSGGSAASVAAGLCVGSLGTDTGGSIRQPASHCNIVGLKPTYGRVSRYGVIAFASSLDQVGPMARTVKDTAHLLSAISGHDENDSTSMPKEVPDYAALLQQGNLNGTTLGIPKQYLQVAQKGLDAEVLAAFESAVATLKKLGAKIVDVSLPNADFAIATYYILAPAEASSNLARYDGVRFGHRDMNVKSLIELYEKSRGTGYGMEVKRRIMLGTYVLSAGYYDAFYLKAQKVRQLIRQDFDQAFKQCDAIISPVTPTPPFKIGEKMSDPMQMYLSDIFTIAVNLAGLPALSVPCGFTKGQLPMGLQIMGNHFAEEKILNLGFNFEQANDFWKQNPKI